MDRRRLQSLASAACQDLFDQSSAIGRLSLVQVAMLAGDTLVTISLAGSLFFSISPEAAKGKVLLYLLLTIAPFAVVSPLLGPAIDASRSARRLVVVTAAAGRVVLCIMMAFSLHSLWLFPEAFCVLVLSKLYLVTRGALVPEMAAADLASGHGAGHGAPSAPADGADDRTDDEPLAGAAGYAGFNARLTLLGTLSGFVISLPGVGLLKLINGAAVLVFAAMVFAAAAVAGARLRVPAHRRGPSTATEDAGVDVLARAEPVDDPEVVLGLTASATIRLTAGFLVFLIAFGLRRHHAPLWWYGFAFAASGAGSLLGLFFVGRLRRVLSEQALLAIALVIVAAAAIGAAAVGTVASQVGLAFAAGVAGAIAQPSFDALTQRRIPPEAQGRIFARFAVRQQLAWVLGALIPVGITMPFAVGDAILAVIATTCLCGVVIGRVALSSRR